MAEEATLRWQTQNPLRVEAVPAVETVLEEAQRLVLGDRRAAYSPPPEDFARVAAMWSVIFGVEVLPRQVPLAMIALKLCRQSHQHKRDSLVDIAGYAQTALEVEEAT